MLGTSLHVDQHIKAASAMQLSKSTLSKCMTELEAQVGVQLRHRSTRAMSLIEAGRYLLKRSSALFKLATRIQAKLDARFAAP